MTCDQEIVHWKNMVKLYKYDSLTGMKQRHDFEIETMHKMTNQSFYLAMFDVTGLHAVNRKQGYAAGDALIRQVAADIKRTDGLWEVYRIGGDEFMALYFDKPNKLDNEIMNATGRCIDSRGFTLLHDMVAAVDSLVTEAKARLGRRREDEDDK